MFPPTYNVHRKDRSDGYGGVFIACHHKLTSSHITLDDNNGNELIAAQLQLPEKEIIICAVYPPPPFNTDSLELTNLCVSLGKIVQTLPSGKLVILIYQKNSNCQRSQLSNRTLQNVYYFSSKLLSDSDGRLSNSSNKYFGFVHYKYAISSTIL